MFTKLFLELSKRDVGIAGGKGASLGEMAQAKIPVPDGFVVLSESFVDFLKNIDPDELIKQQLHTLDISSISEIQSVSDFIQKKIKEGEMSKNLSEEILKNFDILGVKNVAVRSSATAEDSSKMAWAGQLDSFMNITRDDLIKTIKSCWASLFSTRAISYRVKNGLGDKNISVAVIVQKMIQAELAGVAFSVHPISKDDNQIVIESSRGLGEAVVSGSVIPDRYVVLKDTISITEKNIQEESVQLSDEQIGRLAELVKGIENLYKFPVDVEWALKDNQLYILQSRPITTLSK